MVLNVNHVQTFMGYRHVKVEMPSFRRLLISMVSIPFKWDGYNRTYKNLFFFLLKIVSLSNVSVKEGY